MSDDVGDIAAYYNNDPQREHERLERHQLEYDLTWRYLNRYLPRRGSILEIGAATGRYTLELARRGYTLTAVDLSAALLEQCRQRIASAPWPGWLKWAGKRQSSHSLWRRYLLLHPLSWQLIAPCQASRFSGTSK